MPARDLSLLLQAAQAAGEVSLRHWKNAPKSWDKPGGAGPVSVADLEVDALLTGLLRGQRPDYGWLSEEAEDAPGRLSAKRSFILDPIDGTRAFLAGEPGFANALAVTEGARVTAAVIHLPALSLTFAATEDGPATLNGRPIAASRAADPMGATVLTAKSGLAPEHWHGAPPPLTRAFRSSLAYRLCLVAEGRFDSTLSVRPIWHWDIAAGDLIARRAGAVVTDRQGRAFAYNTAHPQSQGLLAAPPALHAALIGGMRDGLRDGLGGELRGELRGP